MSGRYQQQDKSDDSLTERTPLRDNQISENPSFDGYEYNSFKEYEPEDIESEYLANAKDESFEELSDEKLFEQDLKQTLPSTELRKFHTLAKSGTLHRIKIKNKDYGDSIDGPSDNNEIVVDDVFLEEELLEDLENIRNMTTPMERKKTVRLRIKERTDGHRPLSGWQNFKLSKAMKWERFKKSLRESFTSVTIWQSHMKQVEGLFGTGVLSYFTFLRWLLYINLAVSLLTISFLFVPQMIYDQSIKSQLSTNFSGLELLTGEGFFEKTELYYGTYTNEKINKKYDMKYAYLLVGGGYAIACIIILATSMAHSYRTNFITSGSSEIFSSKVFCSWDYGISNKETAKIKMKSFAQDILETLGSERGRFKRDLFTLCWTVLTRILMNFIAVFLIGGSAFLIYYVTENSVKRSFVENHSQHDPYGLLPAITMSGINLVIPTGFRLIVSIENYANPKHGLTINLLRTITLKLASLVVYTITVMVYLVREMRNTKQQNRCWENFLGEAFYKLAIIDFIAVVLATFFEEFLRSVLAKHISCCSSHVPGFDISKNVLNLIYAQGICWIGTFYCPLLPFINVMKLIITFYMKKTSIVRNCRPSTRPFKASKMLLWFLSLLSLMLILALVSIGYIIMDDDALKPSAICGPFRGLDRIYDLVPEIIDELPNALQDAIDFISSLSVIAAFLFLMGLLAYYFRMQKVSNEKKIKLLKQQLSLAGQDRKYLSEKLHRILSADPHVN